MESLARRTGLLDWVAGHPAVLRRAVHIIGASPPSWTAFYPAKARTLARAV